MDSARVIRQVFSAVLLAMAVMGLATRISAERPPRMNERAVQRVSPPGPPPTVPAVAPGQAGGAVTALPWAWALPTTARCDWGVWRRNGTLALSGSDRTWRIAAAVTPPVDRELSGSVTLDGRPAPNLPVLMGVEGVTLDGIDGCPPLPPYASCVLTDAAGNFRARVRGLGLLPVQVDVDAAARRAGRPQALSDFVRVDLAAPAAPLRLAVTGREREL